MTYNCATRFAEIVKMTQGLQSTEHNLVFARAYYVMLRVTAHFPEHSVQTHNKIISNKGNQVSQILKFSVVSLTPISFPSPLNMKYILLINS